MRLFRKSQYATHSRAVSSKMTRLTCLQKSGLPNTENVMPTALTACLGADIARNFGLECNCSGQGKGFGADSLGKTGRATQGELRMGTHAKRRLVLGVFFVLLAGISAVFVFSTCTDMVTIQSCSLSFPLHTETGNYFVQIAEYIEHHKYNLELIYRKSIYQGAYLMRVLTAAYEITKKPEFLTTAISLADELVRLQQDDGYWVVTDQGNIYLADTGSALYLLMILYKYVGEEQQTQYFHAIKKYADTVISDSLVLSSGALSAGYYALEEGGLARYDGPFTIATALTGVEVFTWLSTKSDAAEYKEIAIAAVGWLLNSIRDDGAIPYIFPARGAALEESNNLEVYTYLWETRRYTTSAYVGEALISAFEYLGEQSIQERIRDGLRPHIDMLVATQNQDGTWGNNSHERKRSPGVVNLLAWWYREITPDPRIPIVVAKFLEVGLSTAEEELGVMNMSRDENDTATAFVGRALAELLKPGVDFSW